MQPLSPRRRLIYVWLLALLFLISAPFALFYASGYRYEGGFGFVQTGGMYLSVPYDDATIFLDSAEIKRTSFLNKGFYIDDLMPSTYEVRVIREGSREWKRTLVVEPQVVTRAEVVLAPKVPKLIRLAKGGLTSSNTRGVSTNLYAAYGAAFRKFATTTESDAHDDTVAIVENGDVFVRFISEEARPPDNFCTAPSSCVRELAIERGAETALSVGFFNGGIVYATREGGVYFSEIDARPIPVSLSIYPVAGAGARVVDDELIIKDGSVLYQVEGF